MLDDAGDFAIRENENGVGNARNRMTRSNSQSLPMASKFLSVTASLPGLYYNVGRLLDDGMNIPVIWDSEGTKVFEGIS